MNKFKRRYMMATTAIHILGDISRTPSDLCVVFQEDEENFYGNWVTGFGFVNVKFPKLTTTELTEKEIEIFHGKVIELSGVYIPINIKNEVFEKKVVLKKNGSNKIYEGRLLVPIKINQPIYLIKSNGENFTSSLVKEINNNTIVTRNSIYIIEYV